MKKMRVLAEFLNYLLIGDDLKSMICQVYAQYKSLIHIISIKSYIVWVKIDSFLYEFLIYAISYPSISDCMNKKLI